MRKKDCVALIDISHQGGLGLLSRDFIQAMVHYGGKYRLIDFVLSNCCRSELDIVGILTQWNPSPFHEYIGTGASWGFDRLGAKLEILPSMAQPNQDRSCRSTLEAIREKDKEKAERLANTHMKNTIANISEQGLEKNV